MLAAFLIEHAIAEFFTISVSTILQSILYAFLVVAVTEELVKFFLMKKFMDNPDVDQVIDGVKVGLWVGLGFAFAENTLYFFRFFSDIPSIPLLLFTLFTRGFLSTLAHSLYGIFMGYCLTLAKFHRLYRPRFIKVALIGSILFHGLFNFFLITYLGVASVIMLIVILIIALIWYSDRKSIELNIATDFETKNKPPFLAWKYELETLLSKQQASPKPFEKLFKWFPAKKKPAERSIDLASKPPTIIKL